jgi:radical SAM superfamily enzyme YgiQ (UPF0313 family)
VEKRNVTQYIIYDSAINCHLRVLSTVCDLIIEAGYKLSWRALAMPRKHMPLSLFEKMKRAGCNALEIGLESGSNRILKMMGKRFTNTEAEDFIRKAHTCGIEVILFIIVGFPGETKDDFEETCTFLRRNREYIDTIASINTFMALDDTTIRKNPEKYGMTIPRERGELYWYDEGGNTYEARTYKVNFLTKVARQCGIPFIKDNLIRD